MEQKHWHSYTLYDLMVISLMAGLGLAVKPVVGPLVRMVTGPLFIPGGAVAGGFYMLWLVAAAVLTGKRGSASLAALVQAIIVMATGTFGSHGAASLLTYTIPGLLVDLVFMSARSRQGLAACFAAGLAANLGGTYLSNLLFFRLPPLPLILSLSSAALSGGLGGLIAWRLGWRIRQIRPGQQEREETGTPDSAGDA